MITPIKYTFKQQFACPAEKAFNWCTSFDIDDHLLVGLKDAARKVTYIAAGTVLLTDTFPSNIGTVEKQKLVQIFPKQLTWTSSHITGPNKYSQFLYKITPKGKDTSTLIFSANHIEHTLVADTKSLSIKLCQDDAEAWKLLAQAMKQELG